MKYYILSILAILINTICCAQNRVALIQSELAWGNTQKNITHFSKKIKNIDSCDLIILPELFTSGCDMRKVDKQEKIELKDDVASKYTKTIKVMRRWAKGSGAVIVGSVIYKQDDKYYNRLLAVYPSGEFLHYDKHNCFKKGSFTPGSDHLVIEVNSHRYATYICYDLRNGEWSKNDGRYDSAIYIANWPKSRHSDWQQLLKERAIENSAHIIAVNCTGTDFAGKQYVGGSRVVAPNGSTISEATPQKEDIVIVEY